MVKKWLGLAFIVVVLAVVGVAGHRYWVHSQVHPNTEDAYVAGDVFVVASRVGGTLASVDVTENQPVQQGQAIATLDPRDFDARVVEARTSVAEATAAVATFRAQIEQARARAQADASRLALARTNFERFSELLRRNSVPRQRYDDAAAAEQVASADLQAAQKALAAVQANLTVAEERIKVQEAKLANAELSRTYVTIVAPASGFVAKKSAHVGQVVAPGQPLCAVVPLEGSHVWVEANFKETELQRIKVGQPVTLHTDVDPDRTYRGHVESLSAGTGAAFALLPPENATGNWVKIVQRLPVRILVDPASNADHSLRLGLSVHAEVDTLAEPRPSPRPASAAGAAN